MNDKDSDIGEDEIDVLEEDDMEEVVLVDDNEPFEPETDDINSDEDQNDMSRDTDSPIRDDAEFVFKKHTGPVFCCALDPINGNIAVTGGEDDKAYVWEIQQGQVLLECEGHKDSVTMASFSFDGTYVATGDMNGLIQVWKVATRSLAWSDTIGDLSWLKWHHGTNALLCAATSGDIYMIKIPSGVLKVMPGNAVQTDCAVIMPDGRRLAVGFSDGVVKCFELKTGNVQGTIPAGEAHSLSVSCMDAYSDNNIIATGGGDGKVTLYKTQPLKTLWSFNCNQQDDPNAYIEAVGFSKDPSLPLLAAGTLGGKIYILDFAKQTLRHKCELESGICRLVWDRHSPIVFVGGLEGAVRLYDARSGTLQAQLLGHRETILDICLSADGNTLLSSSDDHTCRVYAVSPPER